MTRTIILAAAWATLFLTPQSLLAQGASANTPANSSNSMFNRLQGSDKPFSGNVEPRSRCAGCAAGRGSTVRKSSAEIQMSVIMPMIFKLNLTADQKLTIQEKMQTMDPKAGGDPKRLDTQRVAIMRAAIAQLTPEQRKTLLNQLAQR